MMSARWGLRPATARRCCSASRTGVLLTLKRSRHVQSLKGQHGGYRLARPANKITLAEVIRLFDGALAPTESVSKYFHESTPIEKEKKLLRVFKKIRDYVSDTLEATTLADVC